MKIIRTASMIVCDDILFGLTGKAFLQGVYTGDITIHGNALAVPQLIFYFTVETSKEKPFKKMTLKVVPFGTAATEFNVPIEINSPKHESRKTKDDRARATVGSADHAQTGKNRDDSYYRIGRTGRWRNLGDSCAASLVSFFHLQFAHPK